MPTYIIWTKRPLSAKQERALEDEGHDLLEIDEDNAHTCIIFDDAQHRCLACEGGKIAITLGKTLEDFE